MPIRSRVRAPTPPSAAEPPARGIAGHVRHVDGTPVAGALVELRRAAFSEEQTLGHTTTDPDGGYAFPDAVAGDLLIKLFQPGDTHRKPRLVGGSAVRYAATPPLRIDVDVQDDHYRRPPEFARLGRDLAAAAGTADILDADARAVAFLAGKTGSDVDAVGAWILAQRIGRALQVDVEAVFGLIRAGFPRTASGILARPVRTLGPAIRRAVRRNAVSARLADRVHQLEGQIHAARARGLSGSHPRALGPILRTSRRLSQAQVASITALAAEVPASELSDRIASLPDLDTAGVAEARRMVALAGIGMSWAPLVAAIDGAIGNGEPSAVARLTAGDWEGIASATSPLPPGLSGTTDEERRADLAGLLAQEAELAFPGAVAGAQLAAAIAPGTALAPAEPFLQSNPTFDLASSRVSDFAAPPVEVAAVSTAQRLYRISPVIGRADAIVSLAGLGFTSAAGVARLGRTRFVAQSAAALGEDLANEVYRKAAQLAGIATTFLLQAHPINSQAPYGFLASSGEDVSALVPDWETLFGNLDYCACAHCRSVLGPAAYLVDLLRFLEDRETIHGRSLYEVLNDRRPDLAAIELSCENTDRALPYIDLTLEALESAVKHSGAVRTDAAHDTVVDASDMLAAPQYVDEGVYRTLAAQTQAMGLPFSRPLAEARVFLTHLGAPRVDLVRAFQEATHVSDAQVALEELGLSTPSLAAITGSGAEGSFWPVASTSALASAEVLRDAAGVTWPDVLDLLHARLANPRVAVGSTSKARLVVSGSDPCDFDTYAISVDADVAAAEGVPTTPVDADWARFRRFVRLWRATGWTILELDKVLVGLGVSDLAFSGSGAPPWLTQLGALHALARTTGRGPVELVAWRSAIDTWDDRASRETPVPSLYAATFLAPSVLPEGDDRRAAFELGADGDLALATTALLSDHLDVLQGALGIDADELDDILVARSLSGGLLSLANVSVLYAWSSVARALHVAPADALALSDLCGLDPTAAPTDANGDDARDFAELAGDLADAGWSVDEIRYVLTHERADRVGPTDSLIQSVLGGLRDALRTALAALGDDTTESSIRDLAAGQLATGLGLDPASLDELRTLDWSGILDLAALAPTFVLAADTPVTLSSPSSVVVPAGWPLVVPAGTAIEQLDSSGTWQSTSLSADLSASPDAAATLGLPVGTVLTVARGATWDGADPTAAVYPAGAPVTLAAGATADVPASTVLVDASGGSWRLPADADAAFEEDSPLALAIDATASFSWPDGAPSQDLVRLFLRTAFTAESASALAQPWDDLVRDAFPDEFRVVEILAKAALILGKLDLDLDERATWYASASDWGLLPVTALRSDATSPGTFAELEATIRLFGLRSRIPGASPTFVELLATVADGPDAFAASLVERTDWDADDATALATGVGAALATADGLDRLLDRFEIVRRVGGGAATVEGWARADTHVTSARSAEIVLAARSRYPTVEGWAGTARPLRDVLRKAQRDALVASLLATAIANGEDVASADDLYEKYLIDVSMNPEMLTSRIRQAACTVQLFVHRLMLGLEKDDSGNDLASFTVEDREQWEWMRTYRVWEAARKVFLYPENWIEPELRDDVSPFFRALQTELAQGDLTDERVEEAALDYLDRLQEVANLEILALYVQKEEPTNADPIDVLHAFARTRADPPAYFYRRFEDGATWTAWEKVECGVEGVHLVPVVFERRLWLFWATITEASGEGDESSSWQIQLCWSTYREGKWAPKQAASDVVVDPQGSSGVAPREYLLSSEIDDDDNLVLLLVDRGSLSDPGIDEFGKVIGRFTLDPCTREVDVDPPDGDTSVERRAAAGSWWFAPAYRSNDDRIDAADWTTELTLYRADVDADGQVAGAAMTEVPVLDTFHQGRVVVPAQYDEFASQSAFFVQWKERAWFVRPGSRLYAASWQGVVPSDADVPSKKPVPGDLSDVAGYLPKTSAPAEARSSGALARTSSEIANWDVASELIPVETTYLFTDFYHPHVCFFIEAVRRDGIFALLDPDPDGPESTLSRQQLKDSFDFYARMDPTSAVVLPYPAGDIDFTDSGAYSLYNWELFFHLPLYVACRLADAGRHDQAMRWFHTMFDPRTSTGEVPTGYPDTAKWWKVVPLMEAPSAPVTDWVAFTGANGDADAASAFADQVAAWLDDPFNPHLIARMRPGTYSKTVVAKYVDNLLAWGDRLFARDTIESINEATQLYVFARQILGDRPEELDPAEKPEAMTYAELRAAGTFDAMANMVLENAYTPEVDASGSGSGGASITSTLGLTAYFCVPQNPTLLSYWDTVADRLFKIRNGMNIEGVVRSLPLFDPPIDPALLVRASAAGIDIGSALDALEIALPNHRFSVLGPRAAAIAGSVRSLGQALLSALEKADAEGLAALRAEQEVALLKLVSAVRERQVDEAQNALQSLKKGRDVTRARFRYYDRLIEKGFIAEEDAAAQNVTTANTFADVAGGIATLGAFLRLVPDFYAGPFPAVKTGGEQYSRYAEMASRGLETTAAHFRQHAAVLTTMAGYKRRAQEWVQQRALAQKELAQLDAQLEGAHIRVEIARKELSNHEKQRDHAEEVLDWMTAKYTSAELYQWMASQIGALHFQTWQLALSLARKAERTWQHELGRTDSFVGSVYWDGNRKGLLAGERLSADLERMDAAYLDFDRRELELVKHVSIDRLDPIALARLRAEGECWFDLPEALFDLDAPGHYFRRLSQVSVTIACVTGPLSQVNAELTLVGSSIRRSASTDPAALEADAPSYASIVTSSGVDDTGLFGAGNDGRYLPFERLGAVSSWHLRFCARDYPQLDWSTVTDVVVHLRYTARDGGDAFRSAVVAALPDALDALRGGILDDGVTGTTSHLAVAVSARRDAPDAWYQAQQGGSLSIPLGPTALPYFAQGRVADVPSLRALVVGTTDTPSGTLASGGKTADLAFAPFGTAADVRIAVATSSGSTSSLGSWPDDAVIALTGVSFADLVDVVVVLEVELS